MENDKTLHNWINKTITKEELENFKQRPEYDKLNELWNATERMQGPEFNKEDMLKEILASSKGEVKQKAKTRRLSIWLPLLAAAALVLVLTFLFYPKDDSNIVQLDTSNSKEQTTKLPDGSKLTLYENSKLGYNESNWNKARELQLTGSAKFQVKKGLPFTVKTDNGQVEVLGTIFTANTEGKKLKVDCLLGKVRVSNTSNSLSDVIEKNESITIINNESLLVKLNGQTKFEDIPVKNVIEELKNHFPKLLISPKDIDIEQKVTGSFMHKNNNNIENVLETALGGFNINKAGGIFYLKE